MVFEAATYLTGHHKAHKEQCLLGRFPVGKGNTNVVRSFL